MQTNIINYNRSSVACISAPEFINVSSISPLVSKAEVKVLYVGKNRNKSFISKEVAKKIAETLPGSPVVGYYRTDKEDFFDHGDVVKIDGDGVHFSDETRPYGFIPPNAKIWFQKFIDTNEVGEEIEREYLMTQAILWTEQYPECKRVVEEGNPHSMKLHDKTLDGTWSVIDNSYVEFFIINDAIIQNLCILGEAVEPCFEGSDIKAPEISKNFSAEDNNNKIITLFSMMQELKELLSKEGGSFMFDNEENKSVESAVEENVNENFSNEQDKVAEIVDNENQNNTEEFKKQDAAEEENPKDKEASEDNSDKEKEDSSKEEKKKEKEDFACGDKEDKKKYELLESEYSLLKEKYSKLEESYAELVAFKNSIEDKQKDELIASFYMLDDEDKKKFIENKSNYSLDDIEKELSVICVRKKVNFNLEESAVEKEAPVTFNLNSVSSECDMPDWLRAVEARREK